MTAPSTPTRLPTYDEPWDREHGPGSYAYNHFLVQELNEALKKRRWHSVSSLYAAN